MVRKIYFLYLEFLAAQEGALGPDQDVVKEEAVALAHPARVVHFVQRRIKDVVAGGTDEFEVLRERVQASERVFLQTHEHTSLNSSMAWMLTIFCWFSTNRLRSFTMSTTFSIVVRAADIFSWSSCASGVCFKIVLRKRGYLHIRWIGRSKNAVTGRLRDSFFCWHDWTRRKAKRSFL